MFTTQTLNARVLLPAPLKKWCAYFASLDMILDQGSLPLLVVSELELRILKASNTYSRDI